MLLLHPDDEATRNICDNQALTNLAEIFRTQIKVGLQYTGTCIHGDTIKKKQQATANEQNKTNSP